MYIKMFTQIVQGVTHSQDALVTMNHLHLANLFAADISDTNLREKTLAELALALKSSLARPGGQDKVAESIQKHGSVYSYPLEAEATIGNEGERPAVTYVYQ